jgi:hypothetical protein
MSNLMLCRLGANDQQSLDFAFRECTLAQLTLRNRNRGYTVRFRNECPASWAQADTRVVHSTDDFDVILQPASEDGSLVSVYHLRISMFIFHPIRVLNALDQIFPDENQFELYHITEMIDARMEEKMLGKLKGSDSETVKDYFRQNLSSVLYDVGISAITANLDIPCSTIDVEQRAKELNKGNLVVNKMSKTFRRVVQDLSVDKQATKLDDVVVMGNCTINKQGCHGTIWLGGRFENNKMSTKSKQINIKRSNLDLAKMLARIEEEGEL